MKYSCPIKREGTGEVLLNEKEMSQNRLRCFGGLKSYPFGEWCAVSQLTSLKYYPFGEDVCRKPVDESKYHPFGEDVRRKPVDESKISSFW
jgi:hypothetical protein